MEIKLYSRSLTTPVLREDLTYRVEDLRFSTKLNGGFHICTFKIKAGLPEAWDWLTKRYIFRILISDVKKTVWEGRIEDVAILPGYVEVTAYGYYANLSDVPYATAYNAVASVVIKAVLTAACAQISTDQTNIDATDVTITSAGNESYLDIYPRQIVEKLTAFSDSTKSKWYFAIWEDRISYLKAMDTSSIDWNISQEDLVRFKLKHRGGDLWNSSYGVYENPAGTIARTATVNDTTSQTKYGLTRRYAVPNMGAVAGAAALAASNGWLQEHKDVWPRMEEFTIGDTVRDTNGMAYPSFWIRAGEVIHIKDLVPQTADLDTIARDALRTFYILETHYNIDSGQLRIVVDSDSSYLDAILTRRL